MKVALNISPLKSGHKVRGIGAYTKNLQEQFLKEKWGIDFEFFQNSSSPPPADVIHYPYFDLFFQSLPIKSNNGRVVTIHDVIPLVFPKHFPAGLRGFFNLFFQKRSLNNVDAVICDSKTSKEDIISKLSYPKDKIHVIYLAPASNFRKIEGKDKLQKVIKKYHLPKSFILYVGDVNWNKNIANLLEAVKLSKVNLVMAGSSLVDHNLPQVRYIDNFIKRLDLESKVTRLGFIPEQDLVVVYNLAETTTLPSFYEGFGLPVLESMACGTPVVCSNVASLAEISKDVAIFCDPKSPQDIAKKINYVLNLSQKEKEKLSQKSQTHAAKFTWHNVAKQTVDVYKSIVQ